MDFETPGGTEFDAIDKVEDQKPVKTFIENEEEIGDEDLSLWTALGQVADQLFKKLYVLTGTWDLDFPEAYNKESSEMLLRCFQQKRLHLSNIVKLLENGADPNTRFPDNFLQSMLHAAVRKVNLRAVKYLIDAGADVNSLNTRHQTPLMLACDTTVAHSIHIVRYLVGCEGVNLHVRDSGGNSALVNAIFKEQPHTVRVLLNAGCRALDERNGPSGWEIAQFVFASGMYLEAKNLPPHFVRPRSFLHKFTDLKGRYNKIYYVWIQSLFKYDAELNYRILQRRAAEEEAYTKLVPVKVYEEVDVKQAKKEADMRKRQKKVREAELRKQRKEEESMKEWQRMKGVVAAKVDRDFSKKLHGNLNDKEYVWERDKLGEWHKSYSVKTSIYSKTPTPDTSYMTSNPNMAGQFLSSQKDAPPPKKKKTVDDEVDEEEENVPGVYKKIGLDKHYPDSMNWVKDKQGNWAAKKGGFRELGFFDHTSGWVKSRENEAARKQSALDDMLDDNEDDQYFHENF